METLVVQLGLGRFIERLGKFIEQSSAFYDIFIEQKFGQLLLEGMLWTLGLTAIALAIGLVIGIIVAVLQICEISKRQNKFVKIVIKILKWITKLYIDIIRGTPVAVQLVLMWNVIMAQSSLPRIWVGGIAFGINSGAYMAELIRAGIQGIDKGQMEAGRSLGFKYGQTMRYIIMPQAFKQMLPAFVSEFITLIKETAIISFIGGKDLMKAGNVMTSITMNGLQPLLIVAICYLLLTGIFTMFMRKLEKKINTNK